MVAEMVPEKELQPKAFSLMPLVWSLGSVFGPAFGGFFASPAEQYPNLFGHIEFFKRFPFALPNLMACCVFFISFMTGLLFLKVSLCRGASTQAYNYCLANLKKKMSKHELTHIAGDAPQQTPQARLGPRAGREADPPFPSV